MRTFARRRHRGRGLSLATKARTWIRWFGRVGPAWLDRVRRWWLPVTLGVLMIAFGIALFSPLFQVRRITVQRSQGRIDVAAVQQHTSALLGHRLLFLSARDVEVLVKDVVPDLKEVTIRKQYPSRLFIRISVDPLVARLELGEPAGAVPAPQPPPNPGFPVIVTQDYLTAGGLYIAASVSQSGVTLPSIRVVDWEVKPAPGSRIITPEFFQKMNDAERILKQEFGQKVSLRTVYLRAREFHLAIPQGSLWFDGESSLEEQLARYRIFLQSVGWKEASRYVDLRLQGRVVYR